MFSALQAQKDLNAIVNRLDESIKNQTINQREVEGLKMLKVTLKRIHLIL
jgi:hypothetical protein